MFELGLHSQQALLSVVELGEKVNKAEDFGLKIQGSPHYDLAQMVRRKNRVVDQLVKGIATLLKPGGSPIFKGREN